MLDKDKRGLFRKIPAVDRLLDHPDLAEVSSKYPRTLILKAINQVLDEIRKRIETGNGFQKPSELGLDLVAAKVVERLEPLARSTLRQVINATGIVVHTNLGRSILAESVLRRFRPLSGGCLRSSRKYRR